MFDDNNSDPSEVVTSQPLSRRDSFTPFCQYLCVCDQISDPDGDQLAATTSNQTNENGQRIQRTSERKLVPLGNIGKKLSDIEGQGGQNNVSTTICQKCYLYKIHVPLSSETDKYTFLNGSTKYPFENSLNRCSIYSHFCWRRILVPASKDTCCYFLCLWTLICWIPRFIWTRSAGLRMQTKATKRFLCSEQEYLVSFQQTIPRWRYLN